MSRPLLRRAVLALTILLCLGALFLPGKPGDLVCRHIRLTDAQSGRIIQGAEDLKLDPRGGGLLLSAYNRRSDEPGGLYGAPLDALLDPSVTRLGVQRLAPPLRPHGFAVSPGPGGIVQLAVIARARGTAGTRAVRLETYALSRAGAAQAGPDIGDPALCNANAVAYASPGEILVTADRAACTAGARLWEDVSGPPKGRLLDIGPGGVRVLASRIGFANGIALDADHVYVAATRARALLIFDRAALGAAPEPKPRSIPLPAAPDNLAWGDDGALYIAAHATLLRFALYRAGLRTDSASLVLRYDPAAGAAAPPVLVGRANRRGAVAGATAALAVHGRILLGAGFDEGISVCARKGMPPP